MPKLFRKKKKSTQNKEERSVQATVDGRARAGRHYPPSLEDARRERASEGFLMLRLGA